MPPATTCDVCFPRKRRFGWVEWRLRGRSTPASCGNVILDGRNDACAGCFWNQAKTPADSPCVHEKWGTYHLPFTSANRNQGNPRQNKRCPQVVHSVILILWKTPNVFHMVIPNMWITRLFSGFLSTPNPSARVVSPRTCAMRRFIHNPAPTLVATSRRYYGFLRYRTYFGIGYIRLIRLLSRLERYGGE